MRLSEKEIQERRKNIILIAFHLFCERGIDSVTLIEIAREAKVGETTIYRYFENKTKLVEEAFIKLWDTIMSQVERCVENKENYEEMTGFQQIAVWIDAFRQLYIENADFILFSYEAKLYLLRHRVKFDRFQQDVLMHAVKGPCLLALEKGKRDGSIPVKKDSEDIFYAIWGPVRGYIAKIVIYDELYGEDSPWRERYEVMEEGILCALKSGWEAAEL